MSDNLIINIEAKLKRFQIFLHGPSADCQDIAIQETLLEQTIEYYRDATDLVQVGHYIHSTRPHICDMRSALSNPFKV